MRDLDFDTDGDGTWTESEGSYTLNAGDTQATYFNTANGGWLPIGTGTGANAFSATLEGNGFVIRNLAVQRDLEAIGLLGVSTGTIRNLGLEQALAENTGTTGTRNTALLVGRMESGGDPCQLRHRYSGWR